MKPLIGLLFILVAIALACAYRYLIANPAMYGETDRWAELAGPVRLLQWVVYALCFAQLLVGVVILSLFRG